MAFKEILQISLTQGSAVAVVVSAESLSDVAKGHYLEIKGELPKLVESVSLSARQLTLSSPWSEPDKTAVKAVIRSTSANFEGAAQKVSGLASFATQWVNQVEALANTITTVTLTLGDESTVEVPSVPKLILDASEAGTTLYNSAQAAVTLMGDAPALAQQVSDDKAVVLSYLNTAVDTEISTGVYSLLHYRTKVLSDYNQIQTWHGNVDGWQQQVTQDKGTVNTAKEDALQAVIDAQAEVVLAADQVTLANNAKTDAETAKGLSLGYANTASNWADLADMFANYPEDQQIPGYPGQYSALHYKAKTQAFAGGQATDSAQLGGIDANQYFRVGNLPTVAQVNGLGAALDQVQTDVDASLVAVQDDIEFNFILALARR